MKTYYGHLARVLHNSADRQITAALAEMELTAAQGHILGFVQRSKHPPCPKDIERTFQLSHPTVSGLLSRLEKKGFVQLRTDETDHRCKRIYLLPKGAQCNERILQLLESFEARIVQDFSPEEKEMLTTLLMRAIRNVKEEES